MLGADPVKTKYVAHSGGGEANASILSGSVDAGSTGLSEVVDQVKAGKETQGRRALVGSGGDVGVFVSRPLTIVLLLVALAALVVPHLPAIMARLRGGDGGPGAFGGAEE